MAKKQDKAPQLLPPDTVQETSSFSSSGLGGSQPVELTDSAFRNQAQEETSTELAAPMADMLTIEGALAESDDTGITAGTWYNTKKVTALWSIDQTRNSWAAVSDLGWKKLADNSDSAIVALTMLASHAKDRNRNVNVRIDSDKIVEMYVL